MKLRTPVLLALLVSTLAAGTLRFLFDDREDGEQAMIERRYEDAVGLLRAALDRTPVEDRDEVLLLIARAEWLSGDIDAAVATYRRLLASYPDSSVVDQARVQQAEALASARRFDEAVELYRAQVERLTAPERKEEIAEVYLGLAAKALAEDPPQRQRAVTFYDLALGLGLSEDRESSIQLKAADQLFAAERFVDSVARYEQLVGRLSIERGRLRAMLGLGRARIGAGNLVGARSILRELIAEVSDRDTPEVGDALYELARTFGVPTPSHAMVDRAIDALRILEEQAPDHPKARIADFLIARCAQNTGRSEDALGALQRFLDKRGEEDLDEVATARAMLGDVLRSQEKLSEAMAAWRRYLAEHPSHPEWERVQRAVIDVEYQSAMAAKAAERFDAARALFEEFTDVHPLDARNARIQLELADMLVQEGRYDEALDTWSRCASKYKARVEASEAQYRIGALYDGARFDPVKALEAFRAVPTGSEWFNQARARIAELERVSMSLRTDRSFRSGEEAVFELTSRNLREVRVRTWRLDLETWFRAMHTPTAIEALDVEVIEPDSTESTLTPDYRPYEETTRRIAVGDGEPGCYVVKVDGGELEATTMVLVTDLGLIVESSREELVVLAQNLKEDRVASGVRIVVSDGAEVVLEGTTDSDGLFRHRGDDLANLAELNVFASDATGSGAGTLGLTGLGLAEGLTQKTWMFTDKPAYQPGSMVHLKGVVREVRDGLYALPSIDPGYRFSVFTPGGRQVFERDLEMTAFGTFAVDFVVPEVGGSGFWTVRAERKDGEFAVIEPVLVEEFQLPNLDLQIDLDERIVFPGDVVKGRVEARHFYGAKAADRPIRLEMEWTDGTSVSKEGQTDAAGAFEFEFTTDDLGEEAVGILTASLPEAGASRQTSVQLVTKALELSLSTVRDVYTVGEPMEVSVRVQDRTGEPAAGPVRLDLLRIERGRRGAAEVFVESRDSRSDDQGLARIPLAGVEGGRHLIRATVNDRFGNRITAQAEVFVSGEEDEVRLRLLTDRENFEVGETVDLRVLNRAGPKLALVTQRGDGVLHCEVRRLGAEDSILSIDLDSEHAPNFGVAVSLIDGTHLRRATRQFLVQRRLDLEIERPDGDFEPGELVPVTIRARDVEGRPVRAELALSLVDEALLAYYPLENEDPVSFFYGRLREVRSVAVTSAGWHYEGAGRPAQTQLLREEERLEAIAGRVRGGGPGGSAGGSAQASADRLRALELAIAEARVSNSTADVARIQQQITQLRQTLIRDRQSRRFAGDELQVIQETWDVQGGEQSAAQFEAGFNSDGWNSAVGLGGGAGGLLVQTQSSAGPPIYGFDGNAFGQGPNGLTLDLFSIGGFEGPTVALPMLSSAQVYQYESLKTGPLSNGAVYFFGLPASGGETLEVLPTSESRSVFAPDGFWISGLETGDDGTVTLDVPMPERSSGWALLTRAVTKDTNLAFSRASMRTSEQLVATVDAPYALTEGDSTAVAVELNHLRRTGEEEPLDLEVDFAGAASDLRIRPGTETRVTRAIESAGTDLTTLDARITGAREKSVERPIRVRPYGRERRVARSGILTASERVRLELPEGQDWSDLRLRVEVGQDPARYLIAMVLGGPLQARQRFVSTISLEARIDRAIAAAAVLSHLDRVSGGTRAERQALDGLLRETLAQVTALQSDNGASNRFEGQKGRPSRRVMADFAVTVKSVRFLQAVRDRGLRGAEPALLKASDWLTGKLTGRVPADQARALEALAAAGRARFESLNSLHRQRDSISPRARAQLALAWFSIGRQGLAGEALDSLLSLPLAEPESDPRSVETLADCVRAVAMVRPTEPRLRSLLSALERARRGTWFGSPAASARAVEALCAAGGEQAAIQNDAIVRVRVDGELLGEVTQESDEGVVILELPEDRVRRSHDLVLDLEGRGEARWSATLSGFQRGFDERGDGPVFAVVNRHYLRSFLEIDGREVRPGFSTVESPERIFRPEIGSVRVGEEFRVELGWSARTNAVRSGMVDALDSVVIEEPLPAGCTVVPDSIEGRFSEVVVLPDRLLFYYPPGIETGYVRFRLVGRYVGSYRVLPTEAFDANQPSRVTWNRPREFKVLPRGAESPEILRWSPDELYALGKHAFDQGDLASARSHLVELTSGWPLRDEILKEVARMMLQLAIADGNAAQTVRWFEELKQRYADLVLSFESMQAVGRAYRSLGEFEAALIVFRGIAEASFLKDAAVSETLRRQNEQQAANDFLIDLVADYPGLPTMRQAVYGIAQGLSLQAVERSRGAAAGNDDPLARSLRERASEIFRSFLLWYPEDPLGPEVSFAWATTLIEGEDLEGSLRVSESALKRYQGSSFEDDFLYTVGFARFALGQTDQALEVLRRVADEEFRTGGGRRARSENKDHAIYLEGQIHHAMGAVEEALADYRRVERTFSDAEDAVAWFERRSLELPEVVRLKSGDPGELTVSYRNLESVDLKVYRVDLMRLYLLEKSLNDIGGVLLHGIRPHYETTLELEGLDFRSHERAVGLPVEDAGAYLVVARSGTDIRSGLMLRSDLEIDAQEDLSAGRIRVHVQRDGAVLPNAHVKIVGSGDQRIRSGDADLRGVFSASDLIGEATVIARVGDEFAFWRGESIHQPGRYQPAPEPQQLREQLQIEKSGEGEAFDPFSNNVRLNDNNRAGQVRWLNDNVLNVNQQGVEVYRAKK